MASEGPADGFRAALRRTQTGRAETRVRHGDRAPVQRHTGPAPLTGYDIFDSSSRSLSEPRLRADV
jgi:hypothetical protein